MTLNAGWLRGRLPDACGDQLVVGRAAVAAAPEQLPVYHDRGHGFDASLGGQRRRSLVGTEVVDYHLLMAAGQFADAGLAHLADRAAGAEDLDALSHAPTVHIPPHWKVKRYRADVRIGELADAVAVPAKTIRYYEAIGLLPAPERHSNGYRNYDGSAADRLRFVKAAQAVGFSLGEIKEILAFRDRGEEPCTHVLDLVDRRAQDIAERIAVLERMRSDLRRLSARASVGPPTDGTYCHLIEHAVTGHS